MLFAVFAMMRTRKKIRMGYRVLVIDVRVEVESR